MRIRSHLIVLVLAATLPVLAFSAVVTTVFWRQQRIALEQRFLERVRALSVALDAELDGQIQVLQVLAGSQVVQTGDLGEFYDLAARLIVGQRAWATIFLTDTSGQELFDLRRPFGAKLPAVTRDSDTVLSVVKTGQPAISRLSMGPMSGNLGTTIMVPVKQNASVRYVIGAVIESSSWLDFLRRYAVAADASMTLLDQDGVVIARTLNHEISAGKRPGPTLYARSREITEGVYQSVGLEGQSFYTAHTRSKISNWTIATGVPKENVEQILWGSATAMGATAVATAVLAIVLAVLFGQRISRPVSALAQSAGTLAGGEAVEPDSSTAVMEVDKVNSAFRESAQRLKARESALRDSEERFLTLANTAPVMIWISGPDKLCTWFNKRWLDFVGRTMEQEVGNGWAANIHPDDLAECLDVYHREFDARLPFTMWFRLRRYDGEYRWILDNGIPLFGSTGAFAGYVGTCIDVTMQKRIEDSLREADRRKDEFLANMSHEIRSPMTSILGYADILSGHLKDPDDLECVKTIKQGGNYLLQLINDILDLSKIEAGKLSLKKEPVSLPALLNEVHSIMSVRAQEKGLPLTLDYDGAVPQMVESDRIRLRQILFNLVSNAIKFTERGSVQIVARFVAEDSMLQIDVADTGIGISKEVKERIFQPFVQADSSATREYGGAGLGLAITKRLTSMMGGAICVKSKEHEGSTFRLSIPTGPVDSLITTPLRAEPAETPSVRNVRLDCTVLVADDRPEIQYLVRHFLEEVGAQVITVGDGKSAIESIQHAEEKGQSIDVLIMDMHMPGLDGYETARTLRAAGSKMPIIALTAAAMNWDREKCLEAGCDAYLKKPIDRGALLELVSRYADHTSSPASRQVQSTANFAHASKRGRSKVLLVDDSDLAARSTSRLLEMSGHEVRTAGTGQSALMIAEAFKPDVVLLDIKLPDLDGYDVLTRLKRMEGLRKTMFVALSGYAAEEIEDNGRGVSFDLVLRKPVDTTYLEAVISSKT